MIIYLLIGLVVGTLAVRHEIKSNRAAAMSAPDSYTLGLVFLSGVAVWPVFLFVVGADGIGEAFKSLFDHE